MTFERKGTFLWIYHKYMNLITEFRISAKFTILRKNKHLMVACTVCSESIVWGMGRCLQRSANIYNRLTRCDPLSVDLWQPHCLVNYIYRHPMKMSSSKTNWPVKELCCRCLLEFIDRDIVSHIGIHLFIITTLYFCIWANTGKTPTLIQSTCNFFLN
jgi:hypothetical protein